MQRRLGDGIGGKETEKNGKGGRDGNQRPPHVIVDLEFREPRNGIAVQSTLFIPQVFAGKGQRLYVTADPAVRSVKTGEGTTGQVIGQGEIGQRPRSQTAALQEIVAEDGAVGKTAVDEGRKGIHVEDALAAEDALVKEGLIGLIGRRGIDIGAAVSRR